MIAANHLWAGSASDASSVSAALPTTEAPPLPWVSSRGGSEVFVRVTTSIPTNPKIWPGGLFAHQSVTLIKDTHRMIVQMRDLVARRGSPQHTPAVGIPTADWLRQDRCRSARPPGPPFDRRSLRALAGCSNISRGTRVSPAGSRASAKEPPFNPCPHDRGLSLLERLEISDMDDGKALGPCWWGLNVLVRPLSCLSAEVANGSDRYGHRSRTDEPFL